MSVPPSNLFNDDTIAAVASGSGGAIAVIRVSGDRALGVCSAIFSKDLNGAEGGRFYYGMVTDDDEVVDDVVMAVFRAPRSYTGEDTVEISCHGSTYIRGRILQLLAQRGVRPARAGEFTMRALLNGKLDLVQAEAVADIISSEDRAAHAVASNQMRGGYSEQLRELREELIGLASLLELELDFGEEDVEFADRAHLQELIAHASDKVERLAGSFATGNAIKNGVGVAIVGRPNVGKSTLLNALLSDDRALVSDIAGTTRDTLEERVTIGGVAFRFIDTAGIRETDDCLELMGIERTHASVARADVVLLVVEAGMSDSETQNNIAVACAGIEVSGWQRLCVLVNKIDTLEGHSIAGDRISPHLGRPPAPAPPRCTDGDTRPDALTVIGISARRGYNLDILREWLLSGVYADGVCGGDVVVSNARHYEALTHALSALRRASDGLSSALPPDLLAQDIRDALHHLGTITGEITTDDLLGEIFSKFCIGK